MLNKESREGSSRDNKNGENLFPCFFVPRSAFINPNFGSAKTQFSKESKRRFCISDFAFDHHSGLFDCRKGGGDEASVCRGGRG